MGCALTPEPLLGPPLAAREVAAGVAWGTSVGPSEVRVRAGDGTVHRLRGNGDSSIGIGPANLGLLMPEVVAFRGAPSERWELGGHGGWFAAGGDARYRLTAPDEGFAALLTAGGQLGYALPAFRAPGLGVPYSVRLLVEGAAHLDGPWQLLLALGASGGRRRHGVDVSSVSENLSIDSPGFLPDGTLAVERSELRLEGATGIAWGGARGGLQLVLMPYVVVSHGEARARDVGGATGTTLLAYRQGFGVSILFGPYGVSR